MSVAAFMAGGGIAGGGGGGGGGGSSGYVDDNFKVINYIGNGAARTIETGGLTGLNTDGCMIWVVARSTITNTIFDTVMGAGNYLNPTTTGNITADAQGITAFTSTGFSIGTSSRVNTNGTEYIAHVFKKTPTALMDIVTFVGTGSSVTVNHSLGTVPGMIFVKRTSGTAQNWMVWHQTRPTNKVMFLNSAENGVVDANAFTAVNSTSFTIGSYIDTSAGANYVAYIFPTNSNVVCSGYTGNGNVNGPSVNIGFEPGFIFARTSTYAGTAYWVLQSKARGMNSSISSAGTSFPTYLSPNAGELTSQGTFGTLQSGFKVQSTSSSLNFNTADYIFMAIRQTNKPASELPTSSFYNTLRSVGAAETYPAIGFNPDLMIGKHVSASANPYIQRREESIISPAYYWNITATGANTDSGGIYFDRHHTLRYSSSPGANTLQGYFFKKTVGFFDIVAYTGNGAGSQTVPHNLGAIPELMIVKPFGADDWSVYFSSMGNGARLLLNTNAVSSTGVTSWATTTPTATNFYVGDTSAPSTTNASSTNYTAYLFASVPGKVKIGTYTGNGAANQDIDCGFSTGARFVMVKPSTTTANWYVFDTTQGINSGADGYWSAQAAAAMVGTGSGIDLIDPYAGGFSAAIPSAAGLNENGHTYVYMAIA